MSDQKIQKIMDDLNVIFVKTDEALNEWQGEGNIQFSLLMASLSLKLNANEKQLRELDPVVRYYVRNHPDWYVTRGAHGGIMRVADKQNKEAAKIAKELAKIEMKALIEAEAAKLVTAKVQPISSETDSEDISI